MNRMRRVCALLVLAIAAPGCPSGGEGGDAAASTPPSNPWWVTINSPFDGQAAVPYASAPGAAKVSMSGHTFVSPTWWGIGGGSATAGVTVTWENLTTGDSGTATTQAEVTYNGIFPPSVSGNDWSALVPVAPGPNHVKVTASDPSGRMGTAEVDFTPKHLAGISPGIPGAFWGTTGDPGDPFNQMTQDSRAQFIVLASDLTVAGVPAGVSLGELHLHCDLNQNGLLQNVRVRMQATSSAALTDFVTGGWTLTSGPISFTPSSGSWVILGFSTPFVWNGTDNLLVELSRDDGGTGPVGGLFVQTGLTARMVAAGQDSVSDWPFDTGLSAMVKNAIPELRLGW